MSNPDNWEELALKATGEYILKNTPKLSNIQYETYEGDILPELVVTPKGNTITTYSSETSNLDPEYLKYKLDQLQKSYELANYIRSGMNKAGNAIGNAAINIADFTPLWWANMAGRAGLAAYNGNWGLAGVEVGLGLLAPYAVGKGLKYLGKGALKATPIIRNDYRAYLIAKAIDKNIKQDVHSRQIILKRQTPNLKLYDILKIFNDGLIRLGYTTSGIKQTKTPTGNFHWREDITDIDNPILLDIKPDMHYIRTHTAPGIKEITNVDDMLLRIRIVPISNNPLLVVEKITVSPVNRLVKVGERTDLTLSPKRVVQFKQQPMLVDNKNRLVSSNANRYFGIPTKIETLYILWHKSGGLIYIKKKNEGKFTASTKAFGEGVQEHVHKVMNNPNTTSLQKKMANFAIQAKKLNNNFNINDLICKQGDTINYLKHYK